MSMVLLQREANSDYHPAGSIQVGASHLLAVLGELSDISTPVQVNQ